jgi:hypothetical protein
MWYVYVLTRTPNCTTLCTLLYCDSIRRPLRRTLTTRPSLPSDTRILLNLVLPFFIFFFIHTAYESRRLWQKGLGQMDSFQRDPPFCLWSMLILILYPRFAYDMRHTRKYKAHVCEGQRFLALNHRPVSRAFGLLALLSSTIIDIHPEVLLPLSQRKKPTGYPWKETLRYYGLFCCWLEGLLACRVWNACDYGSNRSRVYEESSRK